MTNSYAQYLSLLAVMGVVSTPVLANDWQNTDKHVAPNAKVSAYLEANDENDDGFVTRDENEDWDSNSFAKADVNADGKLSRTEIKAFASRTSTDSNDADNSM